MSQKLYIVRQGDYVERIAHRLGCTSDEVWNASANEELRSSGRDPNILAPGDVLRIPSQGAAPPRITPGGTHRYKANVPTVPVRVRLADGRGPAQNKACRVFGLGAEQALTTDGDGVLEIVVPIHIDTVDIEIEGAPGRRRVRIGHMDPADQLSGIQKRLEHLGYYSEAEARMSGNIESALVSAILAFQLREGLQASGEVNDETRERLVSLHGC